MKRMILTGLVFAALSSASLAQPYGGTVYGVYPEGVMIDQGGFSYLTYSAKKFTEFRLSRMIIRSSVETS